MYPFHIEVNNETDLYHLNDGKFQLIRDGKVDSVMVGFKYILVKSEIAEKLQEIGIDRISFKPATIWNRKTDAVYKDYQLMSVHRHFDSSNLNDIDLDGKQFLVLDNQYLFATPELKKALERSELNFSFSEGFSNFG